MGGMELRQRKNLNLPSQDPTQSSPFPLLFSLLLLPPPQVCCYHKYAGLAPALGPLPWSIPQPGKILLTFPPPSFCLGLCSKVTFSVLGLLRPPYLGKHLFPQPSLSHTLSHSSPDHRLIGSIMTSFSFLVCAPQKNIKAGMVSIPAFPVPGTEPGT